MKFKGIFALAMLFAVGAGSVVKVRLNENLWQEINMRMVYYAELEGEGVTCDVIVRRGMNNKMSSSTFFKGLAKTCAQAPPTRKPPSCEDFIKNLRTRLLADDTCDFIDQERIRAQRLAERTPVVPPPAPEHTPEHEPTPAPAHVPDLEHMPNHEPTPAPNDE